MNIAIIGNGGRESAIAWAVSRSPKAANIFIVPGNGGTEKYGKNVPISIQPPFTDILEFVEVADIDLVIIGPEQPLVDGLADVLRQKHIAVFGPSKKAAKLEGSKAYLKEFLAKYMIPSANYKVFTHAIDAIDYVRRAGKPFVVKTDGLAAGKGAIVCKTVDETCEAIQKIMIKREFGSAGDKIVLEDLLVGTEISVFIATDGKDFKWLASAQDHKRAFDDDKGPNTGGMGAFAPTPFLSDPQKNIIIENIIKPTIRGMQKEGAPYSGILYLGLMLTKSGPAVIEYNIRWGDPEAEVVIPLLKTDFLDIVTAVANGTLDSLNLDYEAGFCVGVVLASGGYPDRYTKGMEITGSLNDEPGLYVFHAGTRRDSANHLLTDGGRVICVSAIGRTLKQAVDRANQKAEKIQFENKHYRRDIGKKGIQLVEGF